MKKLIIIAIFILLPSVSHAAFSGHQTVKMVSGNGTVFFGVGSRPSDTCHYYGTDFKFDATTVSGKNMLMQLLLAKSKGLKVHIWYNGSSAPGKTHSNGCTESKLATVYKIGLP